MDPLVIGAPRRGARGLSLRVARTERERAEVRELRRRHAPGGPIPVWDAYDEDEDTLLVVCREADEAVGSLRITRHLPDRGDLTSYFPDMPAALFDAPHGSASVGRVLVAPTHRSADITAALIEAAGLWCVRTTPLRRYLAAAAPRVARFNRFFGARPVLGPVAVPGFAEGLVLMDGSLPGTAARAGEWLTARGWEPGR
ncbi:N-acyl amino acid synthase FeeM domain-containing protein [Streptomyces sp. NPDC050504]|uniref:N-acyl amino acid synthase FeeM domain-containing protein n=1 Tax=Streptomyces sp. NPDC050504 TaxID=3365618 RepID=UPI00378FC1ED